MTTKSDRPYAEPFHVEDLFQEGIKDVCNIFEQVWNKRETIQFDTSQFQQHVRNIQREQLLAVRSLIDGALGYLDRFENR
jgi:hypothetical protein